jgi:integrase
MDKAAFFDFVKETTQLAKELGLVERSKAGNEVKDTTKATYDKIAASKLDLGRKELGGLMTGVSARSWHTIRAALLHVSTARYMEARRACDQAQKSGDWDAAKVQALTARRAVEAVRRIEAAEKPEPTAPRATKRRTLPKSDDWQARVYDAATPAQRPAIALIWATGARPREVEMGASVRWVQKADGTQFLRVDIPGAKVKEDRGQPNRSIVIDPASDAGKALVASMGKAGSITIQRGARRLNKDMADIRDKIGLKVSPYSLRHQFSANLKAEMGADGAEEVAKAMGHAVTRSQGRYGSVRQAQSGQTGVVHVAASRPVKETRSARQPRPAPSEGPKP